MPTTGVKLDCEESMTLDQLQNACRQALDTGKLGTPVAMSVQLQLAGTGAEPTIFAAALIEFARSVFETDASRLMARCDSRQRQWNLLVNFEAGQSLLLNAGCGSAASSQLHFLLIGNRGTLRLEGAEGFEESELPPSENVKDWASKIRESQTSDRALQLS